jgi:hypothetical protein
MDEKIKEDFLAQWPQNKRATIMNQFLGAIRDGLTSLDDITEWLVEDASRRCKSPYADEATVTAQRKVIELASNGGIGDMVDYCLWWESLTSDEKHRIRQSKGTDYAKQMMAAQPPTEKQINYLRALGCAETPLSKAQASEWIDNLVKK